MKGLTGGLLVSLVCSAPLLAQDPDRSLERISLGLQQPAIVYGAVPFERSPPKKLGIFTFVLPVEPGEMVRVSIPIGELLSRAFRNVAAANQRRQEVAARREVEAALAGFVKQQTSALSALTGTWIAEHQGTVFIRLRIQQADGVLRGELETGTLNVDAKGAVNEVTPINSGATPVTKLSVRDSILTFFRVGSDHDDEFRLRVLSDGRAELSFHFSEEMLEELKEEGIPIPQPVAVRRVR